MGVAQAPVLEQRHGPDARRWATLALLGVALAAAGFAVGALLVHARVRTVVKTRVRVHTQIATTTVVRTVTAQPPPVQGFDPGAYAGDFTASGLTVSTDRIGFTHISGQLLYEGGLGCDATGAVELDASFYDANHDVVDTAVAGFRSMRSGSWYPFDAVSRAPDVASAGVVVASAGC